MALISMFERDNSRTVYRILADEAVKCFDHPELCSNERIPFTNLARLLERYRYDAFSDHVPLGILEALNTKNGALAADASAATRHMEAVVRALESAHARVYGALSKDALVQNLQALLGRLASSTPLDEAGTQQDLENARRFFLAFSEGLR
jgi:hypothetical protein